MSFFSWNSFEDVDEETVNQRVLSEYQSWDRRIFGKKMIYILLSSKCGVPL